MVLIPRKVNQFMSDTWNDPSVPPVDPDNNQPATAPPVSGSEPRDAFALPPGGRSSGGPPPLGDGRPAQPWAWAMLWVVIVLLMSLQLVAYFGVATSAGEPEEPAVSADADLSLKFYAALRSLGSAAGSEAAANDSQANDLLLGLENEIKQDGVEGREEARYLAVIQGAMDKEVDAEAIEILEASDDKLDQLTARAVQGDASAAEGLDANSSELTERIARGLALKAGGEENALASLMSTGEALTAFAGPGLFIILTGSGLIVLIGYGIMKGTGGLQPAAQFPLQGISLATADFSALKSAMWLILYFVLGQGVIASVLVLGLNVDAAWAMIAAQVTGLLMIFGLAMLRPTNDEPRLGAMIRGEGSMGKLILAGMAGWVANFPIFLTVTMIASFLLQGLPAPSHAIAEEVANTDSMMTLFALFLTAAVFAPILEEIVFRGWLFQGLLKRTGKVWLSIVISGVTFAVIHPQGPILYGALACIGMMGAFLTYRTGSLVPAIVMHALHNGTLLLIMTLMF